MYFKSFKLAVLALAICAGFSSCKKDDPDPNGGEGAKYTLTIAPASPDSVAFTSSEVELTVTIKDEAGAEAKDISWKASSEASWLSFDPQRGKSGDKFKAIVAANEVEESRTATVVVELVDNSAVKAEVTIIQKKKEINWEVFRKGKFSDFCVGNDAFWGGDYGDHSAVLYFKAELGANGWLTLKTNYRLHYVICEYEPGYIEFVSVPDKQYAAAWTVERTAGKGNYLACGLKKSSDKYLTNIGDMGNDDGELWDHGRGGAPATYPLHLKAGTYWLVCTRAGVGASDATEFPDGYPIDLPVDETISFEKD
jgi:hypothetical protein